MKFHEWYTTWQQAKDAGDTRSYQQFYSDARHEFSKFVEANSEWLATHQEQPEPIIDRVIQKASRKNIEHYWYQECRPYYKAWPAIMRAVSGIHLDVNLQQLDLQPETAILVRFAVGHELESRLSGDCCVAAVLFGSLTDDSLYVIPRYSSSQTAIRLVVLL